jgi:prepilin-type N-terminal cleavage/methylation domain-containing protein
MIKRKNSGFTLVELMIAATILVMLLGGIYYALTVEFDFWDRLVTASENLQVKNMVMGHVLFDVRNADQILPSSTGNVLFLKIGPDLIEYSMKDHKVKRKKNKYTAYLTERNEIGSLSFSYPAEKIVRVKIDDLISRVYARN